MTAPKLQAAYDAALDAYRRTAGESCRAAVDAAAPLIELAALQALVATLREELRGIDLNVNRYEAQRLPSLIAQRIHELEAGR